MILIIQVIGQSQGVTVMRMKVCHFQLLIVLALCQGVYFLPISAQNCPDSMIDYKGNGGGKYCIEFSSDPGVASVVFQGVSLTRSGGSNLYTNGFNCNGAVSYPLTAVVTIGNLTCTFSNGVLPISLVSFTGTQNREGFQLKWQTASEINNEYFLVERSNDSHSFHSIGTISGAGNSSSSIEYAFLDPNPIPGSNYYRLTQFDYDGTSSTSNIVHYHHRSIDPVEVEVANRVLTVFSSELISSLAIYDTGGMLISILHDLEDLVEIDLYDLRPGVYIVNVTTVGQSVGRLISIQ